MENRHDVKNEVIIDFAGSLFKTYKVKNGLYECPICKNTLFYSEKDLIRHILYHAMAEEVS